MYNILVIGDSLVADYDWQSHLSVYQVQTVGIPGATSGYLLASLPMIRARAVAPDVIMVMIGTNDLLCSQEEDILPNLRTIIVRLRQDFPNAEIMVNSLLPMPLPHLSAGAVEDLNNQIEELNRQTGSCYLDTHRRFLASDKQLFQDDGVHLTSAAYSIWTRTFLEHLAFLLEKDDD